MCVCCGLEVKGQLHTRRGIKNRSGRGRSRLQGDLTGIVNPTFDGVTLSGSGHTGGASV
jgi:hypothetical protein